MVQYGAPQQCSMGKNAVKKVKLQWRIVRKKVQHGAGKKCSMLQEKSAACCRSMPFCTLHQLWTFKPDISERGAGFFYFAINVFSFRVWDQPQQWAHGPVKHTTIVLIWQDQWLLFSWACGQPWLKVTEKQTLSLSFTFPKVTTCRCSYHLLFPFWSSGHLRRQRTTVTTSSHW